MRTIVTLPLLALVVGCGMDLDQVQDVEDLRILAVRAEPPEYLIDNAGGLDPANLEFDVSFEVLAVDPRGGRVDVEWQFCPVESTDACRDYETVRDQTPDFASALDAMRAQGSTEEDVATVDVSQGLPPEEAAMRDVWPFDTGTFTVNAPADLALYHVQTNFFGFGSGSWPSAQVRVTGNGDTVLSNKRFVLGVDDYSVLNPVLEDQLGFTVCDPALAEPDQPGCLPLRPATANSNPEFERIEIAFSDLANAPFETIPQNMDGTYDVPAIEPGEMVRFKPVFTADSFEEYQRLETNIDTQELQVGDLVEEISVAWYISGGEIQDPFTWPLFTLTLDTVFTAPDPAPPSGLVSLWMVAQDQRGGTAWVQLEIPIQEGAAGSR